MTKMLSNASGPVAKTSPSRRSVKPRDFDDQMQVPVFQEFVADRQVNDYEPHATHHANRTRRARIAAIMDVLDSL